MLSWTSRRSKPEWEALALQFCRKVYPLDLILDGLQQLPPNLSEQQYAGYVLLHIHRRCPQCLRPILPELLSLLDRAPAEHHPSLPRQLMSIFQDREVEEHLAGPLFDHAVRLFLDRKQPIAARARSLDVCANVASQYEGLWEEVEALVSSIGPEESPGIRSVAARVRRLLQREK